MFKDIFKTINFWAGSDSTPRYEAKNRLELVLAHDRAGVNPELIAQMRQEILEVVSRYIDIDVEATEFLIESNDRTTCLSANLPIKKVKRVNIPEPTIDTTTK